MHSLQSAFELDVQEGEVVGECDSKASDLGAVAEWIWMAWMATADSRLGVFSRFPSRISTRRHSSSARSRIFVRG